MNAQKVTDKELTALEKRLRSVYKAAWKDLKPFVRKYLESFEPRLKKLTADIKAGKAIIPESMTTEEYIKNWKLRYIAQGEEWVNLLNECAERATQANKLAAEITSGKLPSIYGINFNASSYDIAVHAGMQYSVYLPENTIKELTKKNANNVNFKILGSTGKPHYFDPTIDVPRDYAWNQKKIQKALTSGIIQGKSTPKITQDFMKVMGNNQKAAIRNARTACTSAQNAGTMDSMRAAQSMGLEIQKKWLSTLDGRTRASHGHLDGECIGLDEKFSNGLRFPGDPDGSPGEVYNCRCTMENYYPGISGKLNKGNRRAKDDDGTRYTFTGTYDEWKAFNTTISVKNSGAIKGALNDKTDPSGAKRNAHAKKYYESLRNSDPSFIIKAISKNTSISEDEVSTAISHVFLEKHELNGRQRYFYPSYDMTQSVQRLRTGTEIQPHDLTLIHHEATEASFMKSGFSYDEAHEMVNQKYNYQKELYEFNKK